MTISSNVQTGAQSESLGPLTRMALEDQLASVVRNQFYCCALDSGVELIICTQLQSFATQGGVAIKWGLFTSDVAWAFQ